MLYVHNVEVGSLQARGFLQRSCGTKVRVGEAQHQRNSQGVFLHDSNSRLAALLRQVESLGKHGMVWPLAAQFRYQWHLTSSFAMLYDRMVEVGSLQACGFLLRSCGTKVHVGEAQQHYAQQPRCVIRALMTQIFL
jgi:hypothetical protein